MSCFICRHLTPPSRPPSLPQATEGSLVKVGAQNCYSEPKGAFTGAVSASMLKSVGCAYSLVGHSERRQIFGELDRNINRALIAVQDAGITP